MRPGVFQIHWTNEKPAGMFRGPLVCSTNVRPAYLAVLVFMVLVVLTETHANGADGTFAPALNT